MEVSPLIFPLWQQTTAIASVIAGLSAALWHRGQQLEDKARNPFQGGALGTALGLKR